MAEDQILSTLKSAAAKKPSFFLSEIVPTLDEPMPIHQLLSVISPALSSMGLMAKKGKSGC